MQTAVAGRPLQVGILEAMPGPGRHFYSPLEYETQLVKDQVIPPGKIGVVVSKIGKPLPEGTYLVDDKGFRGILRKVLTPGRYRINTYAYDVKVVDVDACAEPGTRVKRKADDPTLIPPGYVGVVTNKASDPAPGEERGIQKQVLQPGIYFLNPEEKRIDIVSIGYSETSLTVEARRAAMRQGGASSPTASCRRGSRPGRPPGHVDGRGSGLHSGQGNRVSLERRLSDSPRLHGDLGHSSRASARRRAPVRHAQGCRAQGDPASDRVDLPAARIAARRGRPAGGRHPRAIPERDLRRAGAGLDLEKPLASLRPDPAHLRAQGSSASRSRRPRSPTS